MFLNAALHGLTRAEVEERMDGILAFAELGEFIDLPVATYSQGMFLRLGFAIAAHLDPDVLLVDEVLAVGDEAFQRKCETRIAEQIAGGATLVLVSHDASLVERTCARVDRPRPRAARVRRADRRGAGVLPVRGAGGHVRPEDALDAARRAVAEARARGAYADDLVGLHGRADRPHRRPSSSSSGR